MNQKYFLALITVCALSILSLPRGYSQNLLPGTIRIEHISSLSYSATFTIYFNQAEPEEFIVVTWGDGSASDTLYNPISVGCGNGLWNGFMYVGFHTYIEDGSYTVSYEDEFLVGGVSNIINSGSQPLLLTARITVSDQFNNNTPVLLQCPIWEWGCCDWFYNPNAYDQDGDSLSYELTTILATEYIPISASIDSVSGNFNWLPYDLGNYALAITIHDWRIVGNDTVNLSSVTHYMLLEVLNVSVAKIPHESTQIFLFPNPANDKIQLETNSSMHPLTSINIYNSTGGHVFSDTWSPGERKKEIPIQNLSSGVYLLKIRTGSDSVTKRFVKD